MSLRVLLDGTIECDSVEEALALSRALKPAPSEQRRKVEPLTEFERRLLAYCNGVATPAHDGRGPKPVSRRDILYACAMKVYSRESARKSRRGMHYNLVLQYMSRVDFTEDIRGAIARARYDAAERKTIQWGPLTAKALVSRVNEGLLRELCEWVEAGMST